MSWLLAIIAFVALFAAFGLLNGALERKRDCHKCPEEVQSPACDTCPLSAAGEADPDARRATLQLVQGGTGGAARPSQSARIT